MVIGLHTAMKQVVLKEVEEEAEIIEKS